MTGKKKTGNFLRFLINFAEKMSYIYGNEEHHTRGGTLQTLMKRTDDNNCYFEDHYQGKTKHEVVEVFINKKHYYNILNEKHYYNNGGQLSVKKYPIHGQKAYTAWCKFKESVFYNEDHGFEDNIVILIFSLIVLLLVGITFTIMAPLFMVAVLWFPLALFLCLALTIKKGHDKFEESSAFASSYAVEVDKSPKEKDESKRALLSDDIEMFTVESLAELYDALAEENQAKILLGKVQEALYDLDADDVIVPAVEAKLQDRKENLEEADRRVRVAFDNANHIYSDNLRKAKDEKLMKILMED